MSKTASICIVTYNNADNIVRVLNSIKEHTKENVKIYIVDNNSSDGTADIVEENFGDITVIRNKDNKGFGHGHNAVIPQLSSDYHFIVNPDILLRDDIISAMSEYLDNNPDVAMAVPRFIYENGQEQFTPKLSPTLKYMMGGRLERFGGCFRRWRDEYTMRGKTVTEPVDVGFCSGCFMAIRTEVFKKINGFDERYFLYNEDADLTRMVQKYGRTVYTPQFTAVHLWARAYMKSPKFFMIQLSSMFKYFYKWRGNGKHTGETNG